MVQVCVKELNWGVLWDDFIDKIKMYQVNTSLHSLPAWRHTDTDFFCSGFSAYELPFPV